MPVIELDTVPDDDPDDENKSEADGECEEVLDVETVPEPDWVTETVTDSQLEDVLVAIDESDFIADGD